MIAKLIKTGLFLFILYEYVKYSLPLYRSMRGIYGIVFLGVSLFVFFALALKLFRGGEE